MCGESDHLQSMARLPTAVPAWALAAHPASEERGRPAAEARAAVRWTVLFDPAFNLDSRFRWPMVHTGSPPTMANLTPAGGMADGGQMKPNLAPPLQEGVPGGRMLRRRCLTLPANRELFREQS